MSFGTTVPLEGGPEVPMQMICKVHANQHAGRGQDGVSEHLEGSPTLPSHRLDDLQLVRLVGGRPSREHSPFWRIFCLSCRL